MNKLIVVLGMHRSGTSAVTRSLKVMGINLGDKMMPPVEGNNPKGFWEDIDINALNIEMMHALNSDWHYLAFIEAVDVETLRSKGFFLRAVDLIRKKISHAPSFGFKDPRVAKLLPFWKEVINYCQFDVSYILAIRNPRSVVKSLVKRDCIEEAKGYFLWLGHVIASLKGSSGKNRVLVDYDLLMHSPDHELERIAQNLDLEINDAELQSYKKEFLDHSLRHTIYQPSDLMLDEACPPLVYEIYTKLLEVATNQSQINSPAFQEKIEQWADEFVRIKSALQLADRLCRQREAAVQSLAECDEQITSLNQAVADRDGQITSLNQAVAERDGQITSLNQAVADRDGQITSLNQAVADRDGQITSLGKQISNTLNSKSWVLTKPFRSLRRNLLSRPHLFFRKQMFNGVRRAWSDLPISTQSKRKLKNLVFTALPFLFRHTKTYQCWQSFQCPITCGPDGQVNNTQYPKWIEDSSDQYVPLLDAKPIEYEPAKLICFYLPQFHPIPENDAWWGAGFTEWANVQPAQPQFVGHYQPHVPGEQGYYNLLDPAVQQRQIELAKLYGIGGFCFYFYWFGGKRLLEQPIENYLNDSSLDLPFCLCWANENWSRRWDGQDSKILIAQQHSADDDLAFIEHVVRYMRDQRYIRIDGRPLLLVYRPSLLPSAQETSTRWRDWCRSCGIGEIYLAYTQSFDTIDPTKYGFDAAIEFPPNNSAPPIITDSIIPLREDFGCMVYDWRALVERSKQYHQPTYKLFRGVCPSWDNTARRKNKSTILLNSSPVGYQEWLYNAIDETCKNFKNPQERLIFINAWNEWAEGAHLEPDQRYGYAYLEATRMALLRKTLEVREKIVKKEDTLAVVIHAFYVDVFNEILRYLNKIKSISIKIYVTCPKEINIHIKKILDNQNNPYFLSEVDNHGRDVLPFIQIMPEVIANGHEILVKVHTKRSIHREDGEAWRRDLLEKLISEKAINDAMMHLGDNPEVGILGPVGHIVPMSYYWGSNAERVEKLSARLGINNTTLKNLNFVAGTMFFARTIALFPLIDLGLSVKDFEPEMGQIDGTMAHAVERLIAVSAHAIHLKTTCVENVSNMNYSYAGKDGQ